MRVVLKWEIQLHANDQFIGPGPVLLVGCKEPDSGKFEVWTEETQVGHGIEDCRRVRIFGTGDGAIPPEAVHLGSVIDGFWVWHLYEMARPS